MLNIRESASNPQLHIHETVKQKYCFRFALNHLQLRICEYGRRKDF